jgi:hypothetical protein
MDGDPFVFAKDLEKQTLSRIRDNFGIHVGGDIEEPENEDLENEDDDYKAF